MQRGGCVCRSTQPPCEHSALVPAHVPARCDSSKVRQIEIQDSQVNSNPWQVHQHGAALMRKMPGSSTAAAETAVHQPQGFTRQLVVAWLALGRVLIKRCEVPSA
eukprot:4265918-Pleurochrysis_carterae.AAC.2